MPGHPSPGLYSTSESTYWSGYPGWSGISEVFPSCLWEPGFPVGIWPVSWPKSASSVANVVRIGLLGELLASPYQDSLPSNNLYYFILKDMQEWPESLSIFLLPEYHWKPLRCMRVLCPSNGKLLPYYCLRKYLRYWFSGVFSDPKPSKTFLQQIYNLFNNLCSNDLCPPGSEKTPENRSKVNRASW